MLTVEVVGNCHISVVRKSAAGEIVRRSILPGRFVDGVWRPQSLAGEGKAVRDLAAATWTEEAVSEFMTANSTL